VPTQMPDDTTPKGVLVAWFARPSAGTGKRVRRIGAPR